MLVVHVSEGNEEDDRDRNCSGQRPPRIETTFIFIDAQWMIDDAPPVGEEGFFPKLYENGVPSHCETGCSYQCTFSGMTVFGQPGASGKNSQSAGVKAGKIKMRSRFLAEIATNLLVLVVVERIKFPVLVQTLQRSSVVERIHAKNEFRDQRLQNGDFGFMSY